MSINSLPPELLRDIIDATIPHSYRATTYEDRQQTLCNVCLVSSRFRQIAQPLLFGIVKIRSEKGFAKLHRSLSTRDRTDADVKTLTCIRWSPHQEWLNTSALDKLSVVCPAVSSLTIIAYGAKHPALDRLSPFQNLSDLHLYGLNFRPATPFLSPRSLALSGFHAISTVFSTSESVVLPSLRYLALTDVQDAFRENPVSKLSMLARLLPQLEAWSIDLNGLEDACVSGGYSTLRPFLSRALVDCRIWSEDIYSIRSDVFNDVRHLRLLHEVRRDDLERLLSLCTSIVEPCPHSKLPRSIYLNRASQSYPSLNGSQARPVQDVEKVCKEKGIEVVFEAQPYDGLTDPVVSQEFWRRMKVERSKGKE